MVAITSISFVIFYYYDNHVTETGKGVEFYFYKLRKAAHQLVHKVVHPNDKLYQKVDDIQQRLEHCENIIHQYGIRIDDIEQQPPPPYII